MNLQAVVVYLAAGFFLIYGIAFRVVPTYMLALVTDGQIQGSSALVDFRATYGGMTIAVGLIIMFLYISSHTRSALIVVIFVLLSMALTRTLGFIIDGATNALMYAYLVLEVAGSLLAFVAIRSHTDDA